MKAVNFHYGEESADSEKQVLKEWFEQRALMSDDRDLVILRRSYFLFTGSIEGALLLKQLEYWTPRARLPGGWIAKTDQEFTEELCLSIYALRKARKTLEESGILETRIAKFDGSPTVHYRLNLTILQGLWGRWKNEDTPPAFLENRYAEEGNSQDGSFEFAKSNLRNHKIDLSDSQRLLTETTTENTTERGAEPSSLPENRAPGVWGLLTPREGKAAKVFRPESPEAQFNWLNPELVDLAVAFSLQTEIPAPLDKNGRSYWRKSLQSLHQNGVTPAGVAATVKYMRGNKLTITDPGSILRMAVSRAYEPPQSATPQFTQFIPGMTEL